MSFWAIVLRKWSNGRKKTKIFLRFKITVKNNREKQQSMDQILSNQKTDPGKMYTP